MPTASEPVKRWRPQVNHLNGEPFMSQHDEGKFVLAQDLESAEARIRGLEAYIRNQKCHCYIVDGDVMECTRCVVLGVKDWPIECQKTLLSDGGTTGGK